MQPFETLTLLTHQLVNQVNHTVLHGLRRTNHGECGSFQHGIACVRLSNENFVYKHLGNTLSLDGPPNIEFESVCSQSGKVINVYIDNVTEYTPWKAIRTAFDEQWEFGNINLK